MENTSKILICDENTEERKKIADYLIKSGFHFVDEASNGNIAIEKLSKNAYDLLVVAPNCLEDFFKKKECAEAHSKIMVI